MAVRRYLFGAGAACAAVLLLVGAWAALPAVALTLPLALFGAGLLALARHQQQLGDRAGRGASSERTVGRILERCGVTVVAHEQDLDAGGDCDHVLLGPVAVVVETKTGKGKVTVGADGSVIVGRRRLHGDPIGQVRRQRNALARQLHCPVVAVVCVADGTGRVEAGDVIVCGGRMLAAVIAAAPNVVSADVALRWADGRSALVGAGHGR